jgi:two-component system chemotaxis family response regulator WspR
MRASDLVARYGGEEFAIILPRASASGSVALAEKIRQTVAEAQLPHGAYEPGIVTVSVGVATMRPAIEVDETTLVQHADRALYLAKKGGRNRVEAHDEVEAWQTS